MSNWGSIFLETLWGTMYNTYWNHPTGYPWEHIPLCPANFELWFYTVEQTSLALEEILRLQSRHHSKDSAWAAGNKLCHNNPGIAMWRWLWLSGSGMVSDKHLKHSEMYMDAFAVWGFPRVLVRNIVYATIATDVMKYHPNYSGPSLHLAQKRTTFACPF